MFMILLLIVSSLVFANSQKYYVYKDTFENEFDLVFDVAVSNNGKVYATDKNNDRIQVFTKEGDFIFAFGASGFNEGEFWNPYSVTVDNDGFVYVSDWGDATHGDRIQKFTPDGDFVLSWEVNNPSDIATDNDGNVYVLEYYRGRLVKFSPNGDRLASWGNFLQPKGLAVSNNNILYVSDTEHRRIQKFTTDGLLIETWQGGNLPHFANIANIAIGKYGNLHVSDMGYDCIYIITPEGEYLNTINGSFNDPRGLDISRNGILYIADMRNNRIQIFNYEK